MAHRIVVVLALLVATLQLACSGNEGAPDPAPVPVVDSGAPPPDAGREAGADGKAGARSVHHRSP